MGLMELLLGRKKPEFVERICLTTERKLAEIVGQVRADRERGVGCVAVTHFQATHRALLEAFDKDGVKGRSIANSREFPTNVLQLVSKEGSTLVLASDAIPSAVAQTDSSQSKHQALGPVTVYLAEHYPCAGRDERVLALDKAWPVRLKFICYTALDEPWLMSPGIDRVRDMFHMLGMDKETAIEPVRYGRAIQLLGRSIRAEQKRLAQQVPHEQASESCQEWVRRNLDSRHGR